MAIPTIAGADDKKYLQNLKAGDYEFMARSGGTESATGVEPSLLGGIGDEKARLGFGGGPPPTMRPPGPRGNEERFKFNPKQRLPLDPRIRAAILLRKRLQSALEQPQGTSEPTRRMT